MREGTQIVNFGLSVPQYNKDTMNRCRGLGKKYVFVVCFQMSAATSGKGRKMVDRGLALAQWEQIRAYDGSLCHWT